LNPERILVRKSGLLVSSDILRMCREAENALSRSSRFLRFRTGLTVTVSRFAQPLQQSAVNQRFLDNLHGTGLQGLADNITAGRACKNYY
jgi:hypothetical protein